MNAKPVHQVWLLCPLIAVIWWGTPYHASAANFSFTNSAPIPISVPGAPPLYPSSIMVSNLAGAINGVTVVLSSVFHQHAANLDVLLVGPAGQRIVLMSDAGGNTALSDTTLAFSDSAGASLPSNGPIVAGTYRPTNFAPDEVFPNPAPPGPYANTLADLQGASPNGTWKLFAIDDNGGSGQISRGWALLLTVPNLPPLITTPPQSQSVPVGEAAIFVVAASGSPPLSYRWLKNGATIVGATTPTYTISSAQLANAGTYSVIVTNLFGSVTSAGAELRVLPTPAITQQPESATVVIGASNVSFSITAVGPAPLVYQWRLNGANLPGATRATLVIPVVQLSDAGSYTVAVANEAAVVESDAALLTLFAPLVQGNDDFNDRVRLSNPPVRGNNSTATREEMEPYHAGKPGSNSVWFSWTAPSSGVATFSTAGSAFDTLLAVYVLMPFGGLTPVASDDDRGGFYTSKVSFNVSAGTIYQIAIDGFAGQRGNFILDWQVQSPALALPVITANPASKTVPLGSNATLSVTATGSSLTYQWLFHGTPLARAMAPQLVLNNVQPANVGSYTVRISNAAGVAVESLPAMLEIGPVSSIQSRSKFNDLPMAAGFNFGATPPTSLALEQPLSSDTLNPSPPVFIPVSAGVPTLGQIMNNTFAQSYVGNPVNCFVIGSATKWLGLQPVAEGLLFLDTFGSDEKTVLGVYSGDSRTTLVPEACDKSNSGPGGKGCAVCLSVTAGKKYHVVIDKLTPATPNGVIRLNWRLGAPELAIRRSSPLPRPPEVIVTWCAPLNAYHLHSTGTLKSPPEMNQWLELAPPLLPVSFDPVTKRNSVLIPTGDLPQFLRLARNPLP